MGKISIHRTLPRARFFFVGILFITYKMIEVLVLIVVKATERPRRDHVVAGLSYHQLASDVFLATFAAQHNIQHEGLALVASFPSLEEQFSVRPLEVVKRRSLAAGTVRGNACPYATMSPMEEVATDAKERQIIDTRRRSKVQ